MREPHFLFLIVSSARIPQSNLIRIDSSALPFEHSSPSQLPELKSSSRPVALKPTHRSSVARKCPRVFVSSLALISSSSSLKASKIGAKHIRPSATYAASRSVERRLCTLKRINRLTLFRNGLLLKIDCGNDAEPKSVDVLFLAERDKIFFNTRLGDRIVDDVADFAIGNDKNVLELLFFELEFGFILFCVFDRRRIDRNDIARRIVAIKGRRPIGRRPAFID